MNSVTITVPDTPEIRLAGYRAHRRSMARLPFRLFLLTFQCVVIAVGYTWLINPDTVLIGIVIIAFGAYPILQPLLVRWRIRRQEAERPTTWLFDEAGLDQNAPLLSARYSWSIIRGIVRSAEGLLLYPKSNGFFWLPTHCFGSSAEIDTLLQLAQTGGVQHIRNEVA